PRCWSRSPRWTTPAGGDRLSARETKCRECEDGPVVSGSWLGGAAAVVTLTFDVDAETPILAQGGRYARHASTMSHQAYGPDVGLPRILDLLDELGVPATFFMPGWVAEQRPGLAARIVAAGHEVAHRSYAHRPPTSLTPEQERADFVRALRVFQDQGVAVAGHRGRAVGGELAHRRPRRRARAAVRLVADGRRPAVPDRHRPRRDRRAAGALVERRLG